MSSGDTPMSTGQQLSESFEPAAAADAINAVLRAPSGSASSGLEMQPGVELDTKDVEMEEVKMDEGGLQTKSDLPSPKSSEPCRYSLSLSCFTLECPPSCLATTCHVMPGEVSLMCSMFCMVSVVSTFHLVI